MRILLTCSLVLLATAAFSQPDGPYGTRGFSIGLHLNGTSWHVDEPDLNLEGSDSGGGLGFDVSYGISDLWTLFLNLDGASIDSDGGQTYTLAHADLGAKLSVGSEAQKFKPVYVIALSGAAAEQDIGPNRLELSGGGLTLGVELLYFLSPAWVLDGGLKFTFGNLTEVKLNNVSVDTDIGARTTRLSAGLRWYPGR